MSICVWIETERGNNILLDQLTVLQVSLWKLSSLIAISISLLSLIRLNNKSSSEFRVNKMTNIMLFLTKMYFEYFQGVQCVFLCKNDYS